MSSAFLLIGGSHSPHSYDPHPSEPCLPTLNVFHCSALQDMSVKHAAVEIASGGIHTKYEVLH